MLSGGGKHITQSLPGTLASGCWVWVPDVQGRWMIPMDASRMILVEVLKRISKKRKKKDSCIEERPSRPARGVDVCVRGDKRIQNRNPLLSSPEKVRQLQQ